MQKDKTLLDFQLKNEGVFVSLIHLDFTES